MSIQSAEYVRETRAKTHPFYDSSFDAWEAARLAYEGGDAYKAKSLVKHPAEQAEDYTTRLKVAVYNNHVRTVVDTYASQLFRRPVARAVTEAAQAPILETLWTDTTRNGISADEFFEDAAQKASVYGALALMVDRYDASAAPASRAQESATSRPYCYAIEPHNLINWDTDEDNAFEWVMVRESYFPKASPFEQFPAAEYRYRLWTKTEWVLYTLEDGEGETGVVYKEQARETHGLGVVPVVMLYFNKPIKPGVPIGTSLVQDIVPVSKRAFNLQSLLDQQLYANCFDLLVVGEKLHKNLNNASWSATGTLCHFNDEQAPKWLAPGLAPVVELRTEIKESENQVRVASGLGRVSESASNESGVSLAYKNVDKAALFERFGQVLRSCETKINALALLWFGLDTSNAPAPVYSVQLEPGQIEDELSRGLKFAALPGLDSETLKANAIALARARFSGLLNQEELTAVLVNLEARFRVATLPDNLLGN